jgi:hypothetical protein
MKTQIVWIVEVAEHFVKLSDGFIAARSNFPGAYVGQKWEVITSKFKIVSIRKAEEPAE